MTADELATAVGTEAAHALASALARIKLGEAYKFAWTPTTPEQGGPT